MSAVGVLGRRYFSNSGYSWRRVSVPSVLWESRRERQNLSVKALAGVATGPIDLCFGLRGVVKRKCD